MTVIGLRSEARIFLGFKIRHSVSTVPLWPASSGAFWLASHAHFEDWVSGRRLPCQGLLCELPGSLVLRLQVKTGRQRSHSRTTVQYPLVARRKATLIGPRVTMVFRSRLSLKRLPISSSRLWILSILNASQVTCFLFSVARLLIRIPTDGLIYLPEIKYRRILNRAFGPGAWGLAPRSETNVSAKIVSREYALVCQGRCVHASSSGGKLLSTFSSSLVAIARGEQEYFDVNGVPTATEACKSNALMRCCKDLGIASELWCVFYD